MSRRTVIRYRDLSGEPQQPPADPVEAPKSEAATPPADPSQGEIPQGEVSTTPDA